MASRSENALLERWRATTGHGGSPRPTCGRIRHGSWPCSVVENRGRTRAMSSARQRRRQWRTIVLLWRRPTPYLSRSGSTETRGAIAGSTPYRWGCNGVRRSGSVERRCLRLRGSPFRSQGEPRLFSSAASISVGIPSAQRAGNSPSNTMGIEAGTEDRRGQPVTQVVEPSLMRPLSRRAGSAYRVSERLPRTILSRAMAAKQPAFPDQLALSVADSLCDDETELEGWRAS